MDLLNALRRPEGKTLELKRELSSPDSVLRTVVAFVNTAGGIILPGVEDGTRHVRGIAEQLALGERLASLISDSISPRLLPDLEMLSYGKTQVVAVQVFPSPTRPHYLTRSGLQGGTYIRVGSTNRRADEALTNEMQRFARGDAFDEGAMPERNSDALDFKAASESFAPVRRLLRRDLETLRLLTSHQGRKVPTVGVIVLFGTDRLRHFADAWVQAGRLEVGIPGLLPFGLTVADVPRGVSKLRNRVIGRVFNELGLVEQRGSSIQRMIAACREGGLAPPMLEEIGIRFRVTLRTPQIWAVDLDPTDSAIMALVGAPEGLSTTEIARGIGLSRRVPRALAWPPWSPEGWCARSAPTRRTRSAAVSQRNPHEPELLQGPAGAEVWRSGRSADGVPGVTPLGA